MMVNVLGLFHYTINPHYNKSIGPSTFASNITMISTDLHEGLDQLICDANLSFIKVGLLWWVKEPPVSILPYVIFTIIKCRMNAPRLMHF